MCTAATFKTKDFYFGRTLDYESSYGEQITVMPRDFLLRFRNGHTISQHFAIIGMAHIADGYPLFYDAVNEKGLAIAGLNFVGNAHYNKDITERNNIAQFELIPLILAKCANVSDAERLLSNINITDTQFSENMPCAQLHWIIADKNRAITAEAMRGGLFIYDNPVGVLTNNPPFNMQLFRLNDFAHLSPSNPKNSFSKSLQLANYSRGMGALGLPGDLSSQSRFIRAAWVRANSVCGNSESESVSQFFHILASVEQQRGCCEVAPGKFEITIYTSCCNADKGIYYYTTYDNHQINAVNMHNCNLNSDTLTSYPLISNEHIFYQN